MQGKMSLFAACALAALLVGMPSKALETLDFNFANTTDAALTEALERVSSLQAAKSEGRIDPADLYAAALTDYRSLTDALYARGHYSGVIRIQIDGREAALIPPLAPPTQITAITVTIDPGPPFRFGQTTIAPLAPNSKLPETFAQGRPAGAGVVTEAAVAAIDGWRAKSHAKALINREEITANHAEHRLDVALGIDPGPAVTFGRLIISDSSSVRPSRIQAIAGLREDAPFDPAALAKAADRLRRTGAFRSVALTEADTLNADNSLDIAVSVIDETPRRYGAGAELSSFEGLTLSGFWLHRNALGWADRFRIEGEIAGLGGSTSGTDYTLSALFERPAVYGPDTRFTARVDLASLDETDYSSNSFKLGFSASKEYSDTLTAELGILYSASHVRNVFGTTDFRLLQFPFSLVSDHRDAPLDPRNGSYINAVLTPFAGLTNTASGARLTLDARGYVSAGEALTFAARGQIGAVFGPSLANTAPEFLFWSGGGGSVRGQPYQSLSVAVPGGTTGGRSFASLSLETRTDLSPTLGLVAFADAGYISGNTDFSNGNWHAGAGIGMRYDTPLGPLRFDLAGPISGTTGDGAQIYIGIGQAF